MRPRRLELSGFTSFKEPTEIDFDGSDFFALVGATGSGKSSVIDAICFALYGSVPRYENRNLVSPVISHGKVEAKVLLGFTIDGKDFTAVRVVRRSGKGATTKEARLESGGEILAGNADEVSAEVERLIGLTFDHFTKCVVLPQGDFARFLHDKPGERQDLVIKLLNLGIYERMRQEATARGTAKKLELDRSAQLLEGELADATPDALAEAKARAKRLNELRKRVAAAKPELDRVEATAKEATVAAAEARRAVALVSDLRMPGGVDELAERVQEATDLLSEMDAEVTGARKEVDAALKARAKLPDRPPLAAALDAHDRRTDLAARAEAAQKSLASAERDETTARAASDQAVSEVEAAEQARAELERAHAAHHLARDLKKGEPCPVCLQPISKLPKHAAVAELDEGAARVEQARKAESEARRALEKAVEAATKARGSVELLEAQLAELGSAIADHPDRSKVAKALDAIDAADDAITRARASEDEVRKSHDQARKAADTLRRQEAKERTAFDRARDRVAALGPPAATRENLAQDWKALVEWGTERAEELAAEATAALEKAESAEAAREELVEDLVAACAECELEIERDEDPLEAVMEAQTEAKAEVADIAAAIDEAKRLRREMKTLEIEQKTAEELALHLSARTGRFESWLVNAALRRLVEGATEILEQLSNGQYALTVDAQGAFQVIDRHNADETRSAKTLSGGETFLASLSLALALADQLSDLASDGAASLEAIFLDEGFGTLDPETLDTVAATVENLASGGRMVGIVTHVRELAERVPVQFRVRKDQRGSTVERVVA